jgi:hypothetical protein
MNEHQTNNTNTQEPTPEKPEKPSLFCIIVCFLVSIGCFAFAIIGILGNMRTAAYNASYGIPSSTGQFAYDISFWIGKNLPIILAIIFGFVFFIPSIKELKAYKKWKKEHK